MKALENGKVETAEPMDVDSVAEVKLPSQANGEAGKAEAEPAAKEEAGLGSKGSVEKLDESDKQIEAAEAAAAAEEAAAEDTRAFMRRLLSYLEPRMLRRLKHHVSKELPPKITRKVRPPPHLFLPMPLT